MDFILAHSRYRRHKYDESIKICDQLLSKNSKDQAAWMLKCMCLIKDNYVDELQTQQQGIAEMLTQNKQINSLAKAGTSFKSNNNVNPIMRPLNSGKLNTGFQRIRTSQGSRAASRANNNMLRTGKIMTKGGVPTTSNGRILRLSTASLQQYGQNFFDSSKVDLRRVAQRKSKARNIFLYLFYVEHNLKKALQLAIYATEMNKYEDPWWKLALGKCYYHLSFYLQAQKQLLSSVKHNNNIQSFLYLSRIYQKQDNVQKSLGILQKASEIHPYEPKLYIWMGRIHEQLNNLQKSHQFYKQVINLQNCNIQAVANIAAYYYYKDYSQIAIKLYQRLIELGYDSPQIWNNLALCCFSNNQYDVFYNCFQKALTLAKDDPLLFTDVWYNIGHIYSTFGDLNMAIQAYKLSLSYLPDNTAALNNLGVIQYRKKNIESAINYGQKSFRQQPNFQAAYNLSLWYFQTLNYEKSYKYNIESLKLYPDHSQSKQLRRRLINKLDHL